MEIRVLRNFLIIASEGNITNAANRIHISQSNLSRQVQDLEKELGVKLFIRNSRSVSLTEEGILFQKRAKDIVSMTDRTLQEFSDIRQQIKGTIYIGGGETYGISPLLKTMKLLQDDYPDIRYHMYSGNASDVTERLDRGLLDFGILIQPTDLDKYHSMPLPDKDVWGIVMKKDCPLAQKQTISRQDLLDVPLICSRQAIRHKGENPLVNWFGEDFEHLRIIGNYNLGYNAALMVENDMGYLLIIDKIVHPVLTDSLCFRPLAPRVESKLDLVWRKDQILSRPAAKLLEYFRNACGFWGS